MKDKLKVFPYREYEQKILEIKKSCKKMKITPSQFIRASTQRSIEVINKTID